MGFSVNNQGPRVLYGNSGAQLASKTDRTVRVFSQSGDFGGTPEDPDVQSAQALAFLREDLKSSIQSLSVSIGDTYVTRQLYNMTSGSKIEGINYRIDGAGWYNRWDASADKWIRVMGGEDPVIDDYYRSVWEQDAFCIRWDGNNPNGGITYDGRPEALNSFRRWVESGPEPCEFRLGAIGSVIMSKNQTIQARSFSYMPSAVMTDVKASSDVIIRFMISNLGSSASPVLQKFIWFNDKIAGDGPGHVFSIEIRKLSDTSLQVNYLFGDDDTDHTLIVNVTVPSTTNSCELEFGNMYIKNLTSGTVIAQKDPVDGWKSDSCYSILSPAMDGDYINMFVSSPIRFIENGRLTGEIWEDDVRYDSKNTNILINRATGHLMYFEMGGSGGGVGTEWGVDTSFFPAYHKLSKSDLTKIDYESYRDIDTSVWYLVTDSSCVPGNTNQSTFKYFSPSDLQKPPVTMIPGGDSANINLPSNIIFANPSVAAWGNRCTVTLDKDGLYGFTAKCTTAGQMTARINNIGFSTTSSPTGPWIIQAQIRTQRDCTVTLEITDKSADSKTCQAGVWTNFAAYGLSSNSTYSTGSSGNNNGFIDIEVPGCTVGEIVEVRNIMLLNRSDCDDLYEIFPQLNTYINTNKRLPYFWDSRGWTGESLYNVITGQYHATHLRGTGLSVWNEHRPYIWTVSRVKTNHHDVRGLFKKNLWKIGTTRTFYDRTDTNCSATFSMLTDMSGPAGSNVAGDVIRVNFPAAVTAAGKYAAIYKAFNNMQQGKPYIFSAYVRADIDDFPFYMGFLTSAVSGHHIMKWETVGRKWKRVQLRMMTPQGSEHDTSINASYRFTKPKEQYYSSYTNYTIEFGFFNYGSPGAVSSTSSYRLIGGCDYTEDLHAVNIPGPCNVYICGLQFEECIGGKPSEFQPTDFYTAVSTAGDYTVVGPSVAAEFGVDQARFIDRAVPSRYEWMNNPRSPKRSAEFSARGRTFVYDPSWTAVEYIETDGYSGCNTGIKCEQGDRVEIDVMQTNMAAINHPNLIGYSNLSGGWANGWYQASTSSVAGRTIVPIPYGESPELYLTNCFRFDYHGDLLNSSTSGSYAKTGTGNATNITMSNLTAVANTLFSVGDTAIIEFDWTLTNWTSATDSNQFIWFGWKNDYHPVGHPCCPETPLLMIDSTNRKSGTYRAELKITPYILENMTSSVFHMSIYSNATGTISWSNLRIWKAGSSNTFSNSDYEAGYSSVSGLTVGSEYVYSVWARADADPGETMAACLMYGSGNASADGASYIYRTFPVTSEWKRYWIRFIARTTSTRLYLKCPKSGYFNANANVTATCMSPLMAPSGKGVMFFAGPKLELYNATEHAKWGPDSFPGRWVPNSGDPEYTNGAARTGTAVNWHYIIGHCDVGEDDRFGIYQQNDGQSALDYCKGYNAGARYYSKVYWPILMRGERCRLIAYQDPNLGSPRARLVKKDRIWDTQPTDMRSWPENDVITRKNPDNGAVALTGFRSQCCYKIGDERDEKRGYHSYRIYGVRIYRDGRLICDLIPVKDRLGTAFGFLDRARNSLVQFSGTTGLTAGPVTSIEYDRANGILPKITGTTQLYNTLYSQQNEPDTAIWRRFGDAEQPVDERDWNMVHDMARVWAENGGDRRPRTDGYKTWVQGVRISNLFFGWYPGKNGIHEIWISGGGENPTRNSWLPGMMPWFASWNDDTGSYIPASDSMLLTRYAAPFHKIRSGYDVSTLSSYSVMSGMRSGSGYQSVPDIDRQWLCNDTATAQTLENEAGFPCSAAVDDYEVPRLNNWEYTAIGWIWTAYWGTPDISTGLCTEYTHECMSSARWMQGQTDTVAQSCIASKAPNVFWKNYTFNEKAGNDIWFTIGETEGHGMGTLGPKEWRRTRTEKSGYDPTGARTDDGVPFVFLWLENPAGSTMKCLFAQWSSDYAESITDYFQTTEKNMLYHERTNRFIDPSVDMSFDSSAPKNFMITDVDMYGNVLSMHEGTGRSRFGHLTVFPDGYLEDDRMWNNTGDTRIVTAGGYAGKYSTGQCSFFDRTFGIYSGSNSPNLTYIGKATAFHSGRYGDFREL